MSEFTFHTLDNAQGEALDLLSTINKSYGFVPNIFGYMAEAPATIKAYLQLNDLLQETDFSNEELQIGLLTASIENNCTFCTAAHQFMAGVYKADQETIKALLAGSEIKNPKHSALVNTVKAVLAQRGWISEAELQQFFEAGYTQKHYLELQLIVTIKTLSNYINHQTKPEANAEFQG